MEKQQVAQMMRNGEVSPAPRRAAFPSPSPPRERERFPQTLRSGTPFQGGVASILKPVCNKRLSVPIYRNWFLSNIRVAITKILEVDKKPLPVPTKI
jgi:hypothetical protein